MNTIPIHIDESLELTNDNASPQVATELPFLVLFESESLVVQEIRLRQHMVEVKEYYDSLKVHNEKVYQKWISIFEKWCVIKCDLGLGEKYIPEEQYNFWRGSR